MSLASVVPDRLQRLLAAQGGRLRIWLVGGALRDHFLNRPIRDLDLVIDGDATALGRRLSRELGGAYYDLDRQRGAGRIVGPSSLPGIQTVDFIRLHPQGIEGDLLSRDFTINALGIPLGEHERLMDPTGGLQDIADRRLRACSPRAIEADPVRALRGARFALELDFVLGGDLTRQIRAACSRLDTASPERVRDELMAMLKAGVAGRSIRLLDHLGLVSAVFPELDQLRGRPLRSRAVLSPGQFAGSPRPDPLRADDTWEHTLRVVDRMDRLIALLAQEYQERETGNLMLAEVSLRLGRYRPALQGALNIPGSHGRSVAQVAFLAALYHEAGSAEHEDSEAGVHLRELAVAAGRAAERVRFRCRRLRMSGEEIRLAGNMVRHHLRPLMFPVSEPIAPLEVFRFFRDAGEAGVPIVLLALAKVFAAGAPHPPIEGWRGRLQIARQLFEAAFEGPPEALNPPRLIRGDRLRQALDGITGPEIGRILKAIEEAQVEGTVKSAEDALAAARRLYRHGLEG